MGQPSTQAFSSRSLDSARNVTSPNGDSFGDVMTFCAESNEREGTRLRVGVCATKMPIEKPYV